jgi:hypothetical protein
MARPDAAPRDYLVAESPAMRAVVATIERLADSDGPVLVCGEHGTGRELVARVLHNQSPRRAGRFVAVRPTFDAGGEGGDDGERAKRHVARRPGRNAPGQGRVRRRRRWPARAAARDARP